MASIELRAEPRTVLGKNVKRLRNQGLIPANIFGHGESQAIQAEAREVERLLAHGTPTAMMSLVVNGDTRTALLRRVSRDPRSGKLQHLDFQAVSLNERVTATVPLHFVGEAPAARLGAVMLFPTTEVKVDALARDLPESIEVDLSTLEEVGASITVADVRVGQKLTLVDPAELVLVQAQAPRIQVEEVEQEAAVAAEVAEATEAGESAVGGGAESAAEGADDQAAGS